MKLLLFLNIIFHNISIHAYQQYRYELHLQIITNCVNIFLPEINILKSVLLGLSPKVK